MKLNLSDILMDESLQIREQISDEAVSDYYEFLREGGTLPPITVFYDGEKYYIGDGWHRCRAHKVAGMATIEANVIQGTRRDAQKYALGANHEHGLRRTQADRRRAVQIVLDDIEWSDLSDRDIAKMCKVSHPLVAKVRKEMSASHEENKAIQPIKEPKNERKTAEGTEGHDADFRVQELADALVQANEEKSLLEDRLAIQASDATEEEKARLAETLADLRNTIKVLEAENRSLKASLAVEVEEKNQLIRQVNYWKKQATKGTK